MVTAKDTTRAAEPKAARAASTPSAPLLIMLGMVSRQAGAALATPLFAVTGSLGVTTLRLVFSGLTLLTVTRPGRIPRASVPLILAYGTVLAGMNTAFYLAISQIPLGVVVTIEFLGPLAIAVFGARRWREGLWALLAGAGVYLLTEGGGQLSPLGTGYALAAACCWIGYILLGARLSRSLGNNSGLTWGMCFGAVLSIPAGVLTAGATLWQPFVLAAGAFLAILSSVIPYSLEYRSLRSIPPRVFGVLMSLEPAIAALAGLTMLGQQLHLLHWLAVACVVAASLGSTLSTPSNSPRPRRGNTGDCGSSALSIVE